MKEYPTYTYGMQVLLIQSRVAGFGLRVYFDAG